MFFWSESKTKAMEPHHSSNRHPPYYNYTISTVFKLPYAVGLALILLFVTSFFLSSQNLFNGRLLALACAYCPSSRFSFSVVLTMIPNPSTITIGFVLRPILGFNQWWVVLQQWIVGLKG
jgi:hypothetical protein